MQVRPDWLSFTVADMERGQGVLSLLPGGRVDREFGVKGYDRSAWICGGHGVMAWHTERFEMGVHFRLPGRALGFLAESCGGDLWGLIAVLVRGFGARFSRIDVAWDDLDGVLPTVTEMYGQWVAGNVVSRWKSAEPKGKVKAGGEVLGEGFTVGSRLSESYLRVYNKGLQMAQRGEDWAENATRVEAEFKGARADAVARAIAERGADHQAVSEYLSGVLRGYITFRVRCEDTNRWRWPVAEWWERFLGFAERAQLVVEKVKRTVEQVATWIDHAVGPSVALVLESCGFEATWGWLFQVTRRGRGRLRPRHKAIIAGGSCDLGRLVVA